MSFTFPYGSGYQCWNCGQWIANGVYHTCVGRYSPPPPPPVVTVIPGPTEERVRQIVREEIERARPDVDIDAMSPDEPPDIPGLA